MSVSLGTKLDQALNPWQSDVKRDEKTHGVLHIYTKSAWLKRCIGFGGFGIAIALTVIFTMLNDRLGYPTAGSIRGVLSIGACVVIPITGAIGIVYLVCLSIRTGINIYHAVKHKRHMEENFGGLCVCLACAPDPENDEHKAFLTFNPNVAPARLLLKTFVY